MADALRVINLVFDGPPAPYGPRLVEVTDGQGRSATLPPGGPRLVEIEDETGRSITIGEWIDRGDSTWMLRIAFELPAGRPE